MLCLSSTCMSYKARGVHGSCWVHSQVWDLPSVLAAAGNGVEGKKGKSIRAAEETVRRCAAKSHGGQSKVSRGEGGDRGWGCGKQRRIWRSVSHSALRGKSREASEATLGESCCG